MNKLALAAIPTLVASLLAQGTPEAEPNDVFSTATPLALGAQGYASIGAVGDVDFWKITLTGASDVRAWINPGIGAVLGDSDLALIAPDGTTELAFNDNAISPVSWLSAVVLGNLVAGDYYLRVRSSQAFAPNGTGGYTIDVIAAPPGTHVGLVPTPTPVTERPDGNDPRLPGGVPTASFVNSTNTGNISAATPGTSYTSAADDYDFFAIDVTMAGTLTMETVVGAAAPAAADTVLFFAGGDGTVLALDDNSGNQLLSRIVAPVTPGSYFVVVKGSVTGNYILDISMPDPVPTGQATVIVRPGGCGPTLNVRQTLFGPTVITEVPVLGSTFYVTGGNMPANALVFRVIGTDPLPQPYNMTPIGAPGCEIQVQPIDQSFSNANALGLDYWALPLPVAIWAIDLTVEQEIAVVDPSANALGVTVTNRVSSVCGIHN